MIIQKNPRTRWRTDTAWRRAGDQMSKILNLRSSKITLLQVDGEAMEAAEVADMAEVKLMIL